MQDCLAFLSSAGAVYPGGVPENYIAAPLEAESTELLRTGVGDPSSGLVFISSETINSEDSGVERSRWPLKVESAALLEAAVSKGMQRSADSVFVFNPIGLCSGSMSMSETCSLFKNEFQSLQPEICVVLGEQAFNTLMDSELIPVDSGEFNPGAWVGNMRITHELSKVLHSQDCKREFWADLKAVMQALPGGV